MYGQGWGNRHIKGGVYTTIMVSISLRVYYGANVNIACYHWSMWSLHDDAQNKGSICALICFNKTLIHVGNSMLNSETLITTVTTSIASFISGSLVFLVVGCICGYRFRHQQNRVLRPHAIEATQPVQLYEEIPQLQPRVRDKVVKLNENLAYDSLHC